MKRYRFAVAGLVVMGIVAFFSARPTMSLPAASRKGGISAGDIAAIKAVMEKYRTSWLAGDAAGVQSTFTEDAVLLPHHGDAPVIGAAEIKKYWWPEGAPPMTITWLNITVEEAGGEGNIGFARGRDEVSWEFVENGKNQKYANSGTYLKVMRKLPDGSWRVSHHMWDDPANQRQ